MAIGGLAAFGPGVLPPNLLLFATEGKAYGPGGGHVPRALSAAAGRRAGAVPGLEQAEVLCRDWAVG